MKKIFLITLTLCSLFLFCASAAVARQSIGILPFKDYTKYDGSWDIQRGIAIWLGETIAQNPFYQVVPTDTLVEALRDMPLKPAKGNFSLFGFLSPKKRKAAAQQRADQIHRVARENGVDILITGEINRFSLSRFRAGLPLLAGYESYAGNVELQAQLQKVIDGTPLGIITGEGEVADRDLGLSLFGRTSDKAAEFYGLDALAFNSDEFKKTVLGSAVDKAIAQLVAKLEQIVVPPPLPKISQPAILLVEGDEVYVNVGIEDRVQTGDKFSVYAPGKELTDPVTGVVLGKTEEMVGVIRIVLIQAAHLSKAEIVEGLELIKVGNSIRVE